MTHLLRITSRGRPLAEPLATEAKEAACRACPQFAAGKDLCLSADPACGCLKSSSRHLPWLRQPLCPAGRWRPAAATDR